MYATAVLLTTLIGTPPLCPDLDLLSSGANVNSVATQGRIVPAFREGRAIGFKLFAIRPASIYAKLGLHSGDILRSINGYDITTPDKALAAFQAIRTPRKLLLEVERRGRTLWIQATMPRADELESGTPICRILTARGTIEAGAPVGRDAWGRPYLWLAPRDEDSGCLASRGADGVIGTDDDLHVGCDLDRLNVAHLAEAAACFPRVRFDAWGRPLRFVLSPRNNLVWSVGADGLADTADDRVVRMGSTYPNEATLRALCPR